MTDDRTATVRTTHDHPDVFARAVTPDNTDEMETTVDDDGPLVTRIERDTTGGLQSTVDDYLVNLDVAARVVAAASRSTDAQPTTDPSNTNDT
jgi:hypothetical protein